MKRTLIILAALSLLAMLVVFARAAPPPPSQERSLLVPPVGTILVSRNLDERLNTSPGCWNHLGVYTPEGVVESLEGRGVVLTTYAEYQSRPYRVVWLVPASEQLGQLWAARATQLVGLPYRPGSSLHLVPSIVPRVLGNNPYGLNCVSVVEYATGYRMRTPDDAWRLAGLNRGLLW